MRWIDRKLETYYCIESLSEFLPKNIHQSITDVLAEKKSKISSGKRLVNIILTFFMFFFLQGLFGLFVMEEKIGLNAGFSIFALIIHYLLLQLRKIYCNGIEETWRYIAFISLCVEAVRKFSDSDTTLLIITSLSFLFFLLWNEKIPLLIFSGVALYWFAFHLFKIDLQATNYLFQIIHWRHYLIVFLPVLFMFVSFSIFIKSKKLIHHYIAFDFIFIYWIFHLILLFVMLISAENSANSIQQNQIQKTILWILVTFNISAGFTGFYYYKLKRFLYITGILLLASIMVFRTFHSILPLHTALIFGGLLIWLFLILTYRYFIRKNKSFDLLPENESEYSKIIQQLVVFQNNTPNSNLPDKTFGGGNFGGGGAGSYH